MASSIELDRVCRFLLSKSIVLPPTNEWLIGCTDWYKSENNQPTGIEQFAFQQWLLADLKVINHGCLPPNVSQNNFIVLPGKYYLQVNYFFDVAESAYSQYQNYLRRCTDNVLATEEKKADWLPKPTRMLKMEMTDGVQTVIGMEYSPIGRINSSMEPGTKVIVKGPLECRSGVLLLNDNNIDILGGEVDTLSDENCTIHLLAKILKLDESVITQNRPVSPPPANNEIQVQRMNNHGNNNQGSARQQVQNNDERDLFNSDDEDLFLNVPEEDVPVNQNNYGTSYTNNHQIQTSRHHEVADEFFGDDDDLLINIEMEIMNERNCAASSSTGGKINQQKAGTKRAAEPMSAQSNSFRPDSSSDSHVTKCTKYSNNKNSNTNFKSPTEPHIQQKLDFFINRGSISLSTVVSPSTSRSSRNNDLEELDSNHFRNENVTRRIDSLQDNKQTISSRCENSNPSSSVQNIESNKESIEINLCGDSPNSDDGLQHVEAQVKKFTSKLLIKGDNWSLTVRLSVGKNTIDASFDPDLLDKIIGFSPAELMSKQKDMAVNPAIKEKMDRMLRRGQQVIKYLNCFMTLQANGPSNSQVIVSISDTNAFADNT